MPKTVLKIKPFTNISSEIFTDINQLSDPSSNFQNTYHPEKYCNFTLFCVMEIL